MLEEDAYMYIIDFIKRITYKTNIPILIYLVLNIFMIAGVIQLFWGESENLPFWKTLLGAILVYVISLFIALSPLGECILRKQIHCKTIKRTEQINFMEPIFREVSKRAETIDSAVPKDVRLFINEDKAPNALATGRKTICITEGLLKMPESQIKAVLGHEFGHLAHKDTDFLLVISVGNLIVNVLIMGIRLLLDLFNIIFSGIVLIIGGKRGVIAAVFSAIYHALLSIFVAGLMWIWTKIGTLLVMKSNRDNEYEADEFAFNLGYGNELCEMLDSIEESKERGLFAALTSSHPNKNDRIVKLQQLGATYQSAYEKKRGDD